LQIDTSHGGLARDMEDVEIIDERDDEQLSPDNFEQENPGDDEFEREAVDE
jgi:hypothetical protein